MALNNATADALAQAICSALGVVDQPSIDKYKVIYRLVYSHLITDVLVTVTNVSGVTPGGGVSGPGTGGVS